MKLRTVTWNIGGAKYLKDGEDPLLMDSYSVDAIPEIAKWLESVDADIITLQEAQGDENSNQVAEIAQLLGYKHYFFDAISPSHIDEGKTLGNGTISKHPIANKTSGLFLNPGISTTLQGKPAVSHDKGHGTCIVDFNGHNIHVTTLHLLPFRPFGIELESEMGKSILQSVESALSPTSPKLLIQGDFNIDSERLEDILPKLFANGLHEITLEEPTTPVGKHLDHVLYRGLSLEKTRIDSNVRTDHYPVICDFIIQN